MEYEHKGVKIAFDANRAAFSATIGGKMKRSSSLAAIKKGIDAHLANAFVPFQALRRPNWTDRTEANYVTVTVSGISKRAGRGAQLEWDVEGRGLVRSVWADTTENRTAIDAYFSMKQKHDAEKKEMNRLEDEAEKKIALLIPEANK